MIILKASNDQDVFADDRHMEGQEAGSSVSRNLNFEGRALANRSPQIPSAPPPPYEADKQETHLLWNGAHSGMQSHPNLAAAPISSQDVEHRGYQDTNPNKSLPFWRTKKGILVLVVISAFILAAILGGILGSKRDNNREATSTGTSDSGGHGRHHDQESGNSSTASDGEDRR
ncbi:hypothetical protein NP233_g2531 [Leucocoprinus birnbaumii]|uniref:Uncharacterized protein n=1 Tax=Leucocoprinus birnbaumii TaxID=56174 RepID=A0AAD5VY83_9AGAR|nr:hypothetical protein NP233_g2531 [Leucocoprinus birnbaumii]